jgi:pilus assembly protein CpaE
VTKLLRSSGLPVSVIDDKHLTPGAAPDLGVIDIRTGRMTPIEHFRTSWPSAAIFAVASSSEPDHILAAMRAGANEFLAWEGPEAHAGFLAAVRRTAEKIRASRDGNRSGVTLSFFGAKGGTGTTTLAVNSATEIARITSRPTLIIDLHPFLGEVALFLGVRPRFSLVDALDNLHRADQEFLKELVVKHKSGLDILAGGEQVDRPGPQDVQALEQLLQLLSRTYDYIVIDAGSVSSPIAEVAICTADTIYLVANPDVAAIRNTHRVADRIAQFGASKDRLRILLNRWSDQHQIGPKQIETALGHPIHMAFPSDYNTVSTAINAGVPLTLSNHSEIAAQLVKLTREIVHAPGEPELVGEKSRSHFLGLF